ncbi:MAG: ribonuclease P protein component 4 [Candidatus Bathyarchaeota archaeon]|nr:ribonuclease P protein component 4 [Candidatus Bathyarchaeota archaeon]
MNYTAKQIAKKRIQILLQQATQVHKTNPALARSYVWSARKIAMAVRIRLPSEYKRQICKKCNTLLVPGESSRVRVRPQREPHVVVTCLHCGNQTRIPLKLKNKEKVRIEQNNIQNEAPR